MKKTSPKCQIVAPKVNRICHPSYENYIPEFGRKCHFFCNFRPNSGIIVCLLESECRSSLLTGYVYDNPSVGYKAEGAVVVDLTNQMELFSRQSWRDDEIDDGRIGCG